MAANLPTIQPFEAGANPAEAWKFWRQDFEDYLQALRYSTESEKTKTALFRHVCGDELKKQYRSFTLQPEPPATDVTLEQILKEFDKFYKDYQNEIYASYIFLEMKQKQGERFQDFYSRLRLAVDECNYGNPERMLRDKMIQGLLDKPLQERLLKETSKRAKTLQEIVSECKVVENSKAQAIAMNGEKMAVEAIRRKKPGWRQNGGTHQLRQKGRQISCDACGRLHEQRNCPAYGTECKKCGFKNHWANRCQTNQKSLNDGKNQHSRRVNAVDHQSDSDSDIVSLGELYVNIVNSNDNSTWFQELSVDGNKVLFKLDTGAQVNVIPKNELLKWKKKPVVKKTKQPVFDYSDNEVPIIGECILNCKTDSGLENLKFVVTSLNSSPILSLKACKSLGLIKRVYQLQNVLGIDSETELQKVCKGGSIDSLNETPKQIMDEFSDVFTGAGRLKRVVKIQLKENCSPHVAAPRKIPLALHKKVRQELQRMEDTGIILKVDTPTEWVSNMVIVDKPNKLRICIDPRPLNEAIKRPHYPIPSAERLITSLQGCSVFSILDAKNGFWQLQLDKASSYLTTFATPWGRYRFLVLPFGLVNGPEEFQRTMEEVFENEPTVHPYFDDIALGSKSMQEHCQLLRKVLTLARQANLKFNPNKMQLAKSKVIYIGHIITDQGIEPNPEKVEAINKFATANSPEDLQRFLGMVTYLAKFAPHLSTKTHSLRQLLKRDTEWVWDSNTQHDFELIKKTLAMAPCLQYFEERKPVTVSVDASKHGIGAVLLQGSKPVAYGSVSLTETQTRYAQIEKELLAVIFGLEHFNYYTYGRPVTVETDHRPLLGLSKKQYDKISPRLQRMLLRLNRYDVVLTYVPGKQLIIADALSRAQLTEATFEDSPIQESTVKVNLLAIASPLKWDEYAELTANDLELQAVIHHVQKGWPEKKNTRKEAQLYWHCKEELHKTKEGILCRGQRLVVPEEARKGVLKKLHISHRGIIALKVKAREYFYWPGMDDDIEEYIGKCIICQRHQRSNQKEPLISRNIPDRPWQKVGCDFFELRGKHYLIMIDYFSKYIEVQLMNSTTANAVCSAMKAIFARHGIPEEVVSDGGPPFNAARLQEFSKEWGFSQNISSPHFPQSNGQVERSVQTLKKSLLKAEEEGIDLYCVLLDYRTTPAGDLPSPAELLMGRRLRSMLPAHPDLLKPKYSITRASKALKERQDRQKRYADQHAKELPKLPVNTQVWFRRRMKEPWEKGTIIRAGPKPRTYTISSANGRVYTRNRVYIRQNKTDPWGDNDNAEYGSAGDYYDPVSSEEMIQKELQVPLPSSTITPVIPEALDNSGAITRSGRPVIIPSRYRDS